MSAATERIVRVTLPRAPWEPAPVKVVAPPPAPPKQRPNWNALALSVLDETPAGVFELAGRLRARGVEVNTHSLRLALTRLRADGRAIGDRLEWRGGAILWARGAK